MQINCHTCGIFLLITKFSNSRFTEDLLLVSINQVVLFWPLSSLRCFCLQKCYFFTPFWADSRVVCENHRSAVFEKLLIKLTGTVHDLHIYYKKCSWWWDISQVGDLLSVLTSAHLSGTMMFYHTFKFNTKLSSLSAHDTLCAVTS